MRDEDSKLGFIVYLVFLVNFRFRGSRVERGLLVYMLCSENYLVIIIERDMGGGLIFVF